VKKNNSLVAHEIFRTAVFHQQTQNEQLRLYFSGKLKYGGGSSPNYFLFVNLFSFLIFYFTVENLTKRKQSSVENAKREAKDTRIGKFFFLLALFLLVICN